MEQIYEQELFITPSLADARGRLSWPGAFTVCQDLAGIHAERLGVGLGAMAEKSLFWLTVRTKIRILDFPRLGEIVTARTWPEKPGALRCNRSYEIVRDSEVLVLGRTEWAVMNTETRALTPAAGLFPADLPFDRGAALSESFARIPDRFEDAEPFAVYRVRSTDIDVGGHMNNAAYLRALFGAFSNRELEALDIRSVDAVFRASCFEGEELAFARRRRDGADEVRISRGEDTILLARLA